MPQKSAVAAACEQHIRQCYAEWRTRMASPRAITVLSIEPHWILLASGAGEEPGEIFLLEFGWQSLTESFFHHQPPGAIELEEAIVPVEDHLAFARALAGNGSLLCSSDAQLLMVARAIGLQQPLPLVLSRQAVEQAFEELSMVALGQRPPRFDGPFAGEGFVAVLLILREFLHHLQFDQLTIAA
jgi:hypothetical protein